jgi:hypothetical protein
MILIGFAAGALIFLTAFGVLWRSDYFTNKNVPHYQPIPFSHKHHVRALGIDCRYCHTSVQDSAYAGMPSTAICMSCHSQVWTNAPMLALDRQSIIQNKPIRWRRIYNLPDYVYFNHSIHVNHGVACQSCHGRVDRMPIMHKAHQFYMKFCLDCHMNPAPRLRPEKAVLQMGWHYKGDRAALGRRLMKKYHIISKGLRTSCYTCHR